MNVIKRRKTESRDIFLNIFRNLAKIVNKNKYVYLSEEDIRCWIYHKIVTRWKHKLDLLNKDNEKEITRSVHAEGKIKDDLKEKPHKIDLLIHYTKKRVPAIINKGRVYFYGNKEQCENDFKEKELSRIKRRYLIEIKVGKNERKQYKGISKRINDDYKKRQHLDFERCYLVYVDRNMKITKTSIKEIKEISQDSRFKIVYIGSGKRNALYYSNGKEYELIRG